MKRNILAIGLLATAATLQAQTPPVHTISTASAVSSDAFRIVASVREVSGGKVLVNDIVARRLVLMDSSMHVLRVVVDSTADADGDSYGTRPGALIPYRGDTTLFVDPVAYSVLVIDGDGKIVRARSIWRAQDANFVASPGMAIGQIGTDARGRIVYRIPAARAPNSMPRPADGAPVVMAMPDSSFVVAADMDTRKIDTLGVVKSPAITMRMTRDNGRFNVSPIIRPLQVVDEWAVLSDGRVAFVRGRDYRIEYVNADGTITSSGKLPFDWQRLSDEDKQQLIDSTRTAMQKVAVNEYATNMIRWANQTGKDYPKDFTIPEGFVPLPGLPKDAVLPPGVKLPENYLYACPASADATPPMAMVAASGGATATVGAVTIVRGRADGDSGTAPVANGCVPAPIMFSTGGPLPAPTMRTIEVVPASDLPDYRPPFPPGAVRADADGNLWVRTLPVKPVPGGPVFDVINSKGELVDRIQLPTGYAIAGFGKDKVVYLSSRDAAGIRVARVRLK